MSRLRSKPIAVLISDVHYTPSTLELADQCYRLALRKAEDLKVPLIDAGDTLDSKDLIRATCANALIKTLSEAQTRVMILVGNHTLVNEKSEENALHFLRPYCKVIQSPTYDRDTEAWLLPYFNDSKKLLEALEKIPRGSRLIMHQGLSGANMGHYVVDKTSLPKEAFADFRVISGHYHRAQDIKCGRPRKDAVGLFSYVGSPYSLSFGEANDGPKGFQILYDDGILELVPTNLRKHVVKELRAESWQQEIGAQDPKDLLWVKISGPKSTLSTLTKADIAKVVGHAHFKLDLIPDTQTNQVVTSKNQTEEELLDSMVDSAEDTPEYKAYLKTLWRSIL